MDDLQKQKAQIDYDIAKQKKIIDAAAYKARQDLANAECEKVRKEADRIIAQIQYDAQR
jgi:hypothetical protein